MIRLVAQDALLLDGTLLENLFTFSEGALDEAAAWQELEWVGMRRRVEALPERLHTRVGDSTFSSGERQLLSLCRACLSGGGRQTLRLLLCDEPTSNVDLSLDQLVHKALLALPQTVLMICHRLQHIGGFDRVLVLDQGQVVEDGEPATLLHDPDSRLSSMCAQVGISSHAVAVAHRR